MMMEKLVAIWVLYLVHLLVFLAIISWPFWDVIWDRITAKNNYE